MAAFEMINGPKELLVLDSENLAAFTVAETREKALRKTIDFLKRYL